MAFYQHTAGHLFNRILVLAGILTFGLLLGTIQPTLSQAQQKPSWLTTGMVANTVALYPGGTSHEQQIVLQGGSTWIREEFNWRKIESQKGNFTWSTFDGLMRNATANRLNVLPLLTGTPSWAGSAAWAYPNNFADYANFVAEVTKRYGPGGTFWQQNPDLDASFAPRWFEIWNEPYIPYFVNGEINPGKYAQMFKAAAIAGKQANPNAKFLIQADYKDHAGNPKLWVDPMYQAVPDLNNYFDAVAVHPYGDNPNTYTPTTNNVQWQVQRYDLVHQQFVSHGAVNEPFWITELGWSTCTSAGQQCVTRDQQAQYTKDLFKIIGDKNQRYLDHIFIYHLRDGDNLADRESGFGHVEHWYGYSGHSSQNGLKPSWYAWRELNGVTTTQNPIVDSVLPIKAHPSKYKRK